MAQKISQMNPVVTPAMTDKLEDAQDGATESLAIALQQIFDLFQAQTSQTTVILTGDYTVQPEDNGKLFVCKGAGVLLTITLSDAATYDQGFKFAVVENTNDSAKSVKIVPTGTNQINYFDSLTLAENNGAIIALDNSTAPANWMVVAADGYAPQIPPVVNINANTYTSAAKDNGAFLYFPATGAAKTLTLPANGSVDLPQGFNSIYYNIGSSAVTISSTDDIVGSTTIPIGFAAQIVKSVYGTPNTWIVRLLCGTEAQIKTFLQLSSTDSPTFAGLTLTSPLGYANGGTNANTLAAAQTNLQITGTQTFEIMAGNMFEAITNPALLIQTESTTNKNQTRGWSFSASTVNNVSIKIPMPKRWDGGTFSYKIFWKTPATSGNVHWQLQAVIRNDGSAEDLAFGTVIGVTDAAQGSANATAITALATSLTPAGTPADNSEIEFRLFRDPANGNDTLADVAIITSAILLYTSNRGNDNPF